MQYQQLIDELQSATEIERINELLDALKSEEKYSFVTELYKSIWKMTYANSSEVDIQEVSTQSIAHQISLMNEQEDLIPAKLEPVKNVEALDLGGFPEAILFPELLNYENLKRLELWENGLKILPDSFFKLSGLEALYICDELVELSPKIEHLSKLTFLDLNGNRLMQIPSELENLHHLKELNLSHNNIEHFDINVEKMPDLRSIDLQYNAENLIISQSVLDTCHKREIELTY